jgi:phosphoglycerate dehydrogenase-like enzyme
VAPYRCRLYEALRHSGNSRALIARFGVGHDGIDKAQCRECGILVTNTPGVLQEAVAELTLALLACLARQVCLMDADMKAGRFRPRTSGQLTGRHLAVIGFGRIGRCVARSAHGGFGMRVTAAGSRSATALAEAEGLPLANLLDRCGVDAYTTDVDRLLATADVVSLHLPPQPDSQPFLDRRRIGLMKPDALLVNTARGSLVDEEVLYDALRDGWLAGAALDVFAREPYVPAVPGKDLRTLPTVVCTPHVGSDTHETNLRMAERCTRNIRAFLRNRLAELDRVDGVPTERSSP